MLLKEGLPI